MKATHHALLLLSLCFATNVSAQWTQKDFNRLRKLAGEWEMKTDKGFLQEKWERVNDTAFTGKSYKIERGVAILDENMTIAFSGRDIVFSAAVLHQNKGLPVYFRLIKIDDGKFVFENKEHDFPTQVIYQVKSSDRLLAWINGTTEKGFRTLSFDFYRMEQ